MARKLEREQKKKRWKGEGEVPSFPSPSPVIPFFFFCSRPNFSRRTHAETLATQANDNSTNFHRAQGQHAKRRPLPLPLKRNRGDPVSGYRVAVHSIPSFQACTGSSLQERGCLVSRFLLTVRRILIGKEHLLGVSPSPHSSICQSWE